MCTWAHKYNMYKVQKIVITNLPECSISFKKENKSIDLFTLNNKIVLRVNNSTVLLSYLLLILNLTVKTTVPHL